MSWHWISCFPHGLWTHEAWSQCYGRKHVELCRRDWEWQGPSVHIINPCHQSIAHELVSPSWQLRKQGYGIVLFPLSSLHDRWRYPESSQSSWTSRLCPIRCGDHALPRPFRSLHMTTHSPASMKKDQSSCSWIISFQVLNLSIMSGSKKSICSSRLTRLVNTN